jgi:hypothetical protein
LPDEEIIGYSLSPSRMNVVFFTVCLVQSRVAANPPISWFAIQLEVPILAPLPHPTLDRAKRPVPRGIILPLSVK